MTINVFSATSQLGGKVIDALFEQGVPPEDLIASTRRPGELKDLQERGVSLREADYDEPDTLHSAFRDTEVLLLIPTKAPVEPRIRQHAGALEAASSAGVSRVVLSSIQAATPDSVSLLAPFYLYAESKLRVSELDWTILRNSLYLDPIAGWAPELVRMGRLPYPVEHGRVAYASRDDLARATAAVLHDDGHNEQVYELTGPDALSMSELAEALSKATGQGIRYERITEAEYADMCRKDDVPERMIDILTSLYRAVDHGEFDSATDHVARLTGTTPESAERYFTRVID